MIGLVEVGEVAQAVGGDMAEAEEVVTLGVNSVVQEGQHGLPEGFDLGDGCEDGPAHQRESPLCPVFEDELHRNHPLTYSTGSYSPGYRYAPSRSCGWGALRPSGSARCRPGRAAGPRRRRPQWPHPHLRRRSPPPGPAGAGWTCCRPRRRCGQRCGSRW